MGLAQVAGAQSEPVEKRVADFRGSRGCELKECILMRFEVPRNGKLTATLVTLKMEAIDQEGSVAPILWIALASVGIELAGEIVYQISRGSRQKASERYFDISAAFIGLDERESEHVQMRAPVKHCSTRSRAAIHLEHFRTGLLVTMRVRLDR